MIRPATLRSTLTAIALASAAGLAPLSAQGQCTQSGPPHFASFAAPAPVFPTAGFARASAPAPSSGPAAISPAAPLSAAAPAVESPAVESPAAVVQDAGSLASTASGSALGALDSLFREGGETVAALGNLLEFLAGACSVVALFFGWSATRRRIEHCPKERP